MESVCGVCGGRLWKLVHRYRAHAKNYDRVRAFYPPPHQMAVFRCALDGVPTFWKDRLSSIGSWPRMYEIADPTPALAENRRA